MRRTFAKRSAMTFYLGLFCMIAFGQQQKLEITGLASGRDGEQVRLIRYTEGPTVTLDSARIDRGIFQMAVPVDEVSPVVLQFKGRQGVLILENAKV